MIITFSLEIDQTDAAVMNKYHKLYAEHDEKLKDMLSGYAKGYLEDFIAQRVRDEAEGEL